MMELYELLMEWLSLIIYEAVMETLMYVGLGLLIVGLITHFIYHKL